VGRVNVLPDIPPQYNGRTYFSEYAVLLSSNLWLV